MVPDYLQDLKPEKTKPRRYMFRNKDEFVPPEWRFKNVSKFFFFSHLLFLFGIVWKKIQGLFQITSFSKTL